MKDKEINRLKEEFNQILSETGDFDLSRHLADPMDLPDLGDMQLYDYDIDITNSSEKSLEVLESLVDLYFGDIPTIKEHPYVKNKMKEDAAVYAETIFLSKMTRKNFITMLKQIDNGDNSARMYEVVNQTIVQIRENAKFSSTQRSELEKFYKGLRSDIDDFDLAPSKPETKSIETESKQGGITDNRSMNDMIKKAMEDRNRK